MAESKGMVSRMKRTIGMQSLSVCRLLTLFLFVFQLISLLNPSDVCTQFEALNYPLAPCSPKASTSPQVISDSEHSMVMREKRQIPKESKKPTGEDKSELPKAATTLSTSKPISHPILSSDQFTGVQRHCLKVSLSDAKILLSKPLKDWDNKTYVIFVNTALLVLVIFDLFVNIRHILYAEEQSQNKYKTVFDSLELLSYVLRLLVFVYLLSSWSKAWQEEAFLPQFPIHWQTTFALMILVTILVSIDVFVVSPRLEIVVPMDVASERYERIQM